MNKAMTGTVSEKDFTKNGMGEWQITYKSIPDRAETFLVARSACLICSQFQNSKQSAG
jgi:hypothetical protein